MQINLNLLDKFYRSCIPYHHKTRKDDHLGVSEQCQVKWHVETTTWASQNNTGAIASFQFFDSIA